MKLCLKNGLENKSQLTRSVCLHGLTILDVEMFINKGEWYNIIIMVAKIALFTCFKILSFSMFFNNSGITWRVETITLSIKHYPSSHVYLPRSFFQTDLYTL